MIVQQGLLLVSLSLLSFATAALALIPQSPQEQTRLAIRSLKNAIETTKANRQPRRFFVDYLIPLPPETKEEDIDPWPGGLNQQYPYGEGILKEILAGIVDEPGPCNAQIISDTDCCGFFVQESQTSAKEDIGAILFPSADQLKNIEEIDKMVGEDRTLLLFNRQFQRPADFGFVDKGRATKAIFDRFQWGFAFQELACRGEDVKLTFDFPNWSACVVCNEDMDKGTEEIALFESSKDRPTYETMEKKINIVLPEPMWMRKMGEVERKGFKFQRGGDKS